MTAAPLARVGAKDEFGIRTKREELLERSTSHPDIALGRQRRQAIYARLCELAALGEAMPSNGELGASVGARLWKMTGILGRLQEDGLIRIEYNPTGHTRRITILATGQSTGWQKPWRKYPEGREPVPTKRRRIRAIKERAKAEAPKPAKSILHRPMAALKRPGGTIAYGYSDSFLYGDLADAVRLCRRRGDVVFRDPRNPLAILINGKPRCPKARAAWHEGRK